MKWFFERFTKLNEALDKRKKFLHNLVSLLLKQLLAKQQQAPKGNRIFDVWCYSLMSLLFNNLTADKCGRLE